MVNLHELSYLVKLSLIACVLHVSLIDHLRDLGEDAGGQTSADDLPKVKKTCMCVCMCFVCVCVYNRRRCTCCQGNENPRFPRPYFDACNNSPGRRWNTSNQSLSAQSGHSHSPSNSWWPVPNRVYAQARPCNPSRWFPARERSNHACHEFNRSTQRKQQGHQGACPFEVCEFEPTALKPGRWSCRAGRPTCKRS